MNTVLPPARPVCRIAEGAARDRDAIDPRLQLAGDREIIHRRADHDDVGREEFVERRLAGYDVLPQRFLFG
jgi:hypothetical protein